MAKTAKGLLTAAKKARARLIAWQERYYELLRKFYLVNGNPAREWIVGSSCSLWEAMGGDRYYFAVAADSLDNDVGDWLIDVDCKPYSDELIDDGELIWRRTHSFTGDWWAGCTAYVLRRMKIIERRLKYWSDKMNAAENAIDDIFYAD